MGGLHRQSFVYTMHGVNNTQSETDERSIKEKAHRLQRVAVSSEPSGTIAAARRVCRFLDEVTAAAPPVKSWRCPDQLRHSLVQQFSTNIGAPAPRSLSSSCHRSIKIPPTALRSPFAGCPASFSAPAKLMPRLCRTTCRRSSVKTRSPSR